MLLPPLTKAESNLMFFLQKYRQEHAVMPSYEDILDGLGYSSPGSLATLLCRIQQKGYIEVEKRLSRGIKFTQAIGTTPIIGTCN